MLRFLIKILSGQFVKEIYHLWFNFSDFSFRFTGNVKLKGVIVIGGENDTHPSLMRL